MKLISRSKWGAAHGTGHPTAGAKLKAYLHHSGDGRLSKNSTAAAEQVELRRIEAYHASDLTAANPRIAYTVCIAPSGRAYEGTGFGRIGAHTANQNSSSYGFCYLGNCEEDEPEPAAIHALGEVRLLGIRQGHLAVDHVLLGHRDAKPTDCPGRLLYSVTVGLAGLTEVPRVEGLEAAGAMPTLRVGSGGKNAPPDLREAVRQLQRLLGMPDQHRTGYFGAITEGVVKDYQREEGLEVDGIVGVLTWEALLGW